jgi:hypothetical protein
VTPKFVRTHPDVSGGIIVTESLLTVKQNSKLSLLRHRIGKAKPTINIKIHSKKKRKLDNDEAQFNRTSNLDSVAS